MSVTWTRAPFDRECGLCGLPIATGAPLRAVTVPGLRRPLVRCAACVAADGGGLPPDLPPLPARAERFPVAQPSPSRRWAHVVPDRARAWVDHRRAASADPEEAA